MNDFMRNVFGKEPKEALYGAIYCFIARMVETPQDVINQVVNFESDKEYIERTLFGIRRQVQELLIELITRVFSECGTELTEEEGTVMLRAAVRDAECRFLSMERAISTGGRPLYTICLSPMRKSKAR